MFELSLAHLWVILHSLNLVKWCYCSPTQQHFLWKNNIWCSFSVYWNLASCILYICKSMVINMFSLSLSLALALSWNIAYLAPSQGTFSCYSMKHEKITTSTTTLNMMYIAVHSPTVTVSLAYALGKCHNTAVIYQGVPINLPCVFFAVYIARSLGWENSKIVYVYIHIELQGTMTNKKGIWITKDMMMNVVGTSAIGYNS